jgi:hypothetical protein
LRARASASRVDADEPFAPFELECVVPVLVLVFSAVVAARDVVPFGPPFTDEDCARDGFAAGVCGRLAAVLVVFVERFALLRFFAMALSALYRELARKPLGFSQGMNGPSPAGDKLPTRIAVSACARIDP